MNRQGIWITSCTAAVLTVTTLYYLYRRSRKNFIASSCKTDANTNESQNPSLNSVSVLSDHTAPKLPLTENDIDVTEEPIGHFKLPFMITDQPSIVVAFGSQSGTASHFASKIVEYLNQNHPIAIQAQLLDLEDFDEVTFSTCGWRILILATYGEGDPPDNAFQFFRWISSKKRERNCLNKIRYSIMGLGNRQYMCFNAFGKKTEHHMKRLGAQSFCVRGEGDDDVCIEKDFNAWLLTFKKAWSQECVHWTHTLSISNSTPQTVTAEDDTNTQSAEQEPSTKPAMPLKLILSSTTSIYTVVKSSEEESEMQAFNYLSAKVIENYELRQEPNHELGLSSFHMELLPNPADFSYTTAGNLSVIPKNTEAVVDWWIKRLELDAAGVSINDYLQFVSRNDNTIKNWFPIPCQLRQFLESFCDLTRLPSISNLQKLCAFNTSLEEKKLCELLFNKDRKKIVLKMVKDWKLSLTEFACLYMRSAKFDLNCFLQLVAKPKPRVYTVSSSSKKSSRQIAITVSQVKVTLTPFKQIISYLNSCDISPHLDASEISKLCSTNREYDGICTNYLKSLSVDSIVYVSFSRSSFKLPEDRSLPLIMIATGTGIAPFRGFWHEFEFEKNWTGEKILFFGCRYSQKDWIYKDEMERLSTMDPPIINHMFYAFSRQQNEYVQQLVKQQAGLVWKLLQAGAFVYICGKTSMGKGVALVLNEIAETYGVKDYVITLRKARRYYEEVWS